MNAYLTPLAAAIFCMIAVLSARSLLFALMRRSVSPQLQDLQTLTQLKPAELAYLAHRGDMDHTMMVIVVDMIQRLVKSNQNEEQPLFEPYEIAIRDSVRQFVHNIAERKAGHLIPLKALKDPVQWLLRIRAIKAFFGKTWQSFGRDFIKDPLQIKRYFSLTGIMRFTLELSTSTARTAVKEPLRAQLLQKGLLVEAGTKSGFAYSFGVAAIGLLIAFVFVVHHYLPATHLRDVMIAAQLGFFNAVLIRAVLSIPSLIPSYEEFQRIAADLPRTGVRMTLLRQAVRWIALLTIIWAAALSLMLGAFELLVNTGAHFMPAAEMIPLILAGTASGLAAVQLLIDARATAVHDQPSATAVRQIRRYHNQVAETRPLSGLKHMLSQNSYDPQFSNILAIYGLETLWLLG